MTSFWIVMHPVAVVLMYGAGACALGFIAVMFMVWWDRFRNALEGIYPNDTPRPVKIKRRRSASRLLPMEPEKRAFWMIWRRA